MKLKSLTLLLFVLTGSVFASNKTEFVISGKKITPDIYIDKNADSLIVWAINDLAGDIETITGNKPKIQRSSIIQKGSGIYVGEFKDSLMQTIHLNQISNLKGAWEKFQINDYQENLIISGSDVRGTVYGIFEVAQRLGISPWKWWADVKPLHQTTLTLKLEKEGITQQPSVQYRGIFLNDEDWGLQPWAAKTFELETGDIGPKTYEKIFQLLLRLKANAIWPAMHPSTKAFFRIPGNKEMAEKYHIFIGTSHAEPMLRNNVDEWKEKDYGEFNYFSNSKKVKEYWQERIIEVKNGNNIITVGMRGVHDSGMEGNASTDEKVKMLETVIKDQREILTHTFNRPIEDIPQVLIPYKEVLDVYNDGLKVPDDITLMWTDDNYGYISRLSNEAEQQRKGGSGVYYHLSYWGRPHDYLWLSTTQPGLIYYEMAKAYANGAQKIWIANVGDIKPAEYTMELFLNLAWNINAVKNDNIDQHMNAWASREFGKTIAGDVTKLMTEYYQLAFLRKPEYMGWSSVEPETNVKVSEFNSNANGNELQRRISLYTKLSDKADQLKKSVPNDRLDAWFQLVEYPVKGAALMNQKFLYAQMAKEATDSLKHKEYTRLSREAYQQIIHLTTFYNEKMSAGKWKYMMSMNPRQLKVYDMPENILAENNATSKPIIESKNKQRIFLQASEYTDVKGCGNYKWDMIKGLGYSNRAITLSPFENHSFGKEQQPYIEYTFDAEQPGQFELNVRCLPCHSNNFDNQIGIQIDSNEVHYFSIDTKGRSEQWKQNVLRNSQIVNLKSELVKNGKHTIRLYVNQTGIVIDQLSIDFAMDQPFYEIPFKN